MTTTGVSIRDFLLARVAEDEALANAAIATDAPDSWENPTTTGNHWPENIAFWDHATPYRLLRECAAKRAIVEACHSGQEERPTDAELHARAAHPAYEYETTEGPRKQWDNPEEPPEGEGWEPNTAKGYRDGWARLEYTEESYWRRLKPEGERREWKPYIPRELRALAAVYSDHPDYQDEWKPEAEVAA